MVQRGAGPARMKWAGPYVEAVSAAGRSGPPREVVVAGEYDYLSRLGPDGLPIELALDHGFPAVVWTSIELADGPAVADAIPLAAQECQFIHAPHGPVRLTAVFTPRPTPDAWRGKVPEPEGLGRRLVLLHFLDASPQHADPAMFGEWARVLGRHPLLSPLVVAPFAWLPPGRSELISGL